MFWFSIVNLFLAGDVTVTMIVTTLSCGFLDLPYRQHCREIQLEISKCPRIFLAIDSHLGKVVSDLSTGEQLTERFLPRQ